MKEETQAKPAQLKVTGNSERGESYSSLSDNDLLTRIKYKSDERAFAELMDRYKDKVRGLAFKLLYHAESAEDAMQDVFCNVWRTRDRWDVAGTAQFSTWIYRVTVNRCVDVKRKQRPQVDLDDVELVNNDANAELQMSQTQVSGIIKGLLDDLPASQALALRLYYLEEKTIPEISKEMKKTEQSVRSMIKRGKAGLRQQEALLATL